MNRKEKLRNRLTVGHVLIVFLLFILAIMIIIPFWNAIVISFMPSHEVTRHPAALRPYGFTWENYKYLFERGGLLGAYKNTLILTLCGTVYGMTISTMMADMGRVFPMGVQMSALVLTMLPIMCVYPFLQKYFMKGMAIGAVKM